MIFAREWDRLVSTTFRMSFLCINRHLNRLVQRFPVAFVQVCYLIGNWITDTIQTPVLSPIFYRPISGVCVNWQVIGIIFGWESTLCSDSPFFNFSKHYLLKRPALGNRSLFTQIPSNSNLFPSNSLNFWRKWQKKADIHQLDNNLLVLSQGLIS